MHQKRVVAVEIEVAKKITQKFLLFEKSIATANIFRKVTICSQISGCHFYIFTLCHRGHKATNIKVYQTVKYKKKLATEF